MSRGPQTSHYDIYDYWKDKAITKEGNVVTWKETNLDSYIPIIDAGEPQCFGCGKPILVEHEPKYDEWLEKGDFKSIWSCKTLTSSVQRSHIIPDSLGGEDKPENLLLLCPDCHFSAPATSNPKMMLSWCCHQAKYNNYHAQYLRNIEEKAQTMTFIAKDMYGMSEEEFVEGCKILFSLPEKDRENVFVSRVTEHGKKASKASGNYALVEAIYHLLKNAS